MRDLNCLFPLLQLKSRLSNKPDMWAMAILEDAATARGNTASVVILCAEETVRAAIAYWSTLVPARTVVAEDGYHANRMVLDGNCRLLVTDRVLPPWPGLDTFRKLRERRPDLRIAFVEGVRREDVSLARLTGVTDVLPRPLRRQMVADAISAAMRAS